MGDHIYVCACVCVCVCIDMDIDILGAREGLPRSWSAEIGYVTVHVKYAERTKNKCILMLACFLNIVTLNLCVSMSYTGLHRRSTLFGYVWLRHRNTGIPEHVVT